MATSRNTLQLVINGINKAGPALSAVGTQLAAVGAAASAAVGVSVREFAGFEQRMTEISTLLDGPTSESMQKMGDNLLRLSTLSGQAIEPLQKAQYDVISAGFTDAAASMNVLVGSTKLASAGVTDVASAADLVTTTMNAMGIGADEVSRVTDVLFQTVRKGKTTLPELSASLGNVFSTAKTAGVSLEEVGAVMATLTSKGINTNESVTALNNLMVALAAPTDEAAKAMADLGIDLDGGIIPALESLGAVGEDGLDALSELIPNIRALKAAAAAGKDVDTLRANLDAMNNASGVTTTAFDAMQATLSAAIDQLKATVRTVVIEFGSQFAPAIQDVTTRLSSLARWVRESPRDLLALAGSAMRAAMQIGALGVLLVGSVKAMKAAQAGMTQLRAVVDVMRKSTTALNAASRLSSLRFILIGGALGVALLAVVRFKDELANLVSWLWAKLQPAVLTVGRWIGEFWPKVLGWAQAAWTAMQSAILNVISTVVSGMAKIMRFGNRIGIVGDDALATADSLDELSRKLGDMADTDPSVVTRSIADEFRKTKENAVELADDIGNLVQQVPGLGNAFALVQEALAAFNESSNESIDDLITGVEGLGETAGETADKLEEMKDEGDDGASSMRNLQDAAEFARQDVENLAFALGNNVANAIADVGTSLVGLGTGTVSVAQAFKRMASAVISDIIRITTRILVARALLKKFGADVAGIGGGGGTASAGGAVLGMAVGGPIGGVIGGAVGGLFAANGMMNVPGTPGLDRTMVLASGGEMILSNRKANMMREALSQPQVGVGFDKLGRSTTGSRRDVTVNIDVSRPLRRSEQIDLLRSIDDAEAQSGRFNA